jgi:hypothetical protein
MLTGDTSSFSLLRLAQAIGIPLTYDDQAVTGAASIVFVPLMVYGTNGSELENMAK